MRDAAKSAPGGGQIEVIAGGMFSGKSEELVRRLRRAVIARQRVQVFKPELDTRHDSGRLVTRDQRELAALSVRDSAALRAALDPRVEVIGVDEVQFFDAGIVDLAMELADLGVRVILAGLDQDFLRRPFGPIPALLAVAEEVDKMHAVCVRCGEPAHYSQRTVVNAAQVLVGDVEAYEARCRRCYEPNFGESPRPPQRVKATVPAPRRAPAADARRGRRARRPPRPR